MNPGEAEATPMDATAERAIPADDQPMMNEADTKVYSTPRDEMMNSIIEQREQMKQETTDSESGQQTEPEMLTVKIDGTEQQIPIEQAKATIQKNMAADKRLNDAVLKQRHLQEWEQQLQRQQQQQEQQRSTEVNVDTRQIIQDAVDALYDGETDNAVEALAKVLGRSQATLNTEQISQKATEQVMQTLAKQQFDAEVAEGNRQFNQEFPDIANEPVLLEMADRKTIELMTTHSHLSPTQIINEAGRQTRAWLQGLSGQHSPTRAERKQSLQDMPRSTGSIAYQPPVSNTASNKPIDVIQQMRQQRNQA